MEDQEKQAFIKIATPFALEIANKESTDEEVVIARVNEMVQDALLPHPLTTDGLKIANSTIAVLTGAVLSPFQKETGYDYTKLRTDTTVASLAEVMDIITQNKDLIPTLDSSKEATKKSGKAFNDCSLAIFEVLNKNNVRMDDYPFLFNVLKTILNTLEGVIDAQVQGHKNEIYSRLVGSKNPGNNKFDGAFSTYGDLTKLLESVRKETGDNMEDYFTVTKE